MKKLIAIIAGLLMGVAAFAAPNSYVDAYQLDADGNRISVLVEGQSLSVTNMPDGMTIARGLAPGFSAVSKFGAAPDFDEDDGEVTVWDGAEDDAAWELMRYVYSTSADIDSVSSSATNDIGTIEVQGLGATSNLVVQTATLNGQTRVALSTNLYRVFRIKNTGSSNFVGHVFAYPNTTLASGVPATNNTIRAVVHPENNQTEMAVYSVPFGKVAYLCSVYASTAGANRESNYIIKLYARSPGGVFQLKHKEALADDGSSRTRHPFEVPLVFAAGTDLELTAEMTLGSATDAAIAGGFQITLIDD